MKKKKNQMEIYSIIGFVLNYGGGIDLRNGIVQRIIREEKKSITEIFEKACLSFFQEINQNSEITNQTRELAKRIQKVLSKKVQILWLNLVFSYVNLLYVAIWAFFYKLTVF